MRRYPSENERGMQARSFSGRFSGSDCSGSGSLDPVKLSFLKPLLPLLRVCLFLTVRALIAACAVI